VGKWLFSCLGIRDDPVNISTSTEKGLTRNLSRLRNLPLWADEYRSNSNKTKKLTQTLLNIFNRASSTRADFTNDDRTLTHIINGVLLISGQATPDDEALYSRIVGVNLSEWERNGEVFKKMQKEQKNFSNLSMGILKKEAVIRKTLIEEIDQLTEYFLEETGDPRTSENYGSVIGALLCVIKALNLEDKLEFDIAKFPEWVYKHLNDIISVKKGKDELLSFFRDINRILNDISEDEKECEKGGIRRFAIPDRNKDIVYLAIHDLWVKYEKDMQRRGKKPTFSEMDIKSYIKKEPYFKGYPSNRQHKKKFNGKPKPCMLLDYAMVNKNLLPALFCREDKDA